MKPSSHRVKRRVIRQMYVSTLNKFQGKSGKESVQGAEDDNKPLLSGNCLVHHNAT